MLDIYQWFGQTISGLTRLQEVFKAAEQRPAQMTVRKLQMTNNDYVNLLKDLKDRGEYRFIIDCKVDKIRKLLHAVSRAIKWIVTMTT